MGCQTLKKGWLGYQTLMPGRNWRTAQSQKAAQILTTAQTLTSVQTLTTVQSLGVGQSQRAGQSPKLTGQIQQRIGQTLLVGQNLDRVGVRSSECYCNIDLFRGMASSNFLPNFFSISAACCKARTAIMQCSDDCPT